MWNRYFEAPISAVETPPPFSSRMPFSSAIGAIARVGGENEVSTACTPFRLISRFIAATPSLATPDLWSSITASSLMPSTPPLALISSTACCTAWLITLPYQSALPLIARMAPIL